MQKLIGWLLVSALFIPPMQKSLAQETSDEQLQVKQRLDQWRTALMSHDVEKMMSFYADDANTILIVSNGQQLIGTPKIREIYEMSFKEAEFKDAELADLKIMMHDNVAVITCKFKADTIYRAESTHWTINCRTTFVLVKTGSQWLITMEHSSVLPDVPRIQRRE